MTTRDGEDYCSPTAAIYGPKTMIINEMAGSGGDALPWMFRLEKLGPLVGKRTWGGLVGIYDYPVLMDGGVRRGTDVLKALALGARAVLIGRPHLWGLAADGDAGVRHVLELLKAELELAMALSGCPTIESIDRSLVRVEQAAGGTLFLDVE